MESSNPSTVASVCKLSDSMHTTDFNRIKLKFLLCESKNRWVFKSKSIEEITTRFNVDNEDGKIAEWVIQVLYK